MGTRAQIDVRQGNKVVRVYTQFDGFPRNILPALREAASEGRSTPRRIAQAIMKSFGEDHMQILDSADDRSQWMSYNYVVDVSAKPWRVRQTREAYVDLPTKSDGSLDDSTEALENSPTVPATTRSIRIEAV